MAVEAAIYSRLSGYSALTTLLATSTSIWPKVAPQGAAQPYVVFEVLTDLPTPAMGVDVTPTEALVDVSVVADDYDTMLNLAQQVKAALNRYSGTAGGVVVQHIFQEAGGADIFDQDKKYFQRTRDYRVYYEE